MQSICSVIPAEFNRQVIDARADLSEDPLLGAIYDPPFAHFTHQLAEEYDWEGLGGALAGFAARHQPFQARTSGLLCFAGGDAGMVVAVFRSPELVAYQTELWELCSRFATGNVPGFYAPENWVPHITIKRCGKHFDRFGAGMAKLAQASFVWTMTIDSVSVQHDPGKNSLTHYQRLDFPFGGAAAAAVETETNASIEAISETEHDGAPHWAMRVRPDGGVDTTIELTAPERVRLMAACNASSVYFAGGRCRLEGRKVTAVAPKTPFPVM